MRKETRFGGMDTTKDNYGCNNGDNSAFVTQVGRQDISMCRRFDTGEKINII